MAAKRHEKEREMFLLCVCLWGERAHQECREWWRMNWRQGPSWNWGDGNNAYWSHKGSWRMRNRRSPWWSWRVKRMKEQQWNVTARRRRRCTRWRREWQCRRPEQPGWMKGWQVSGRSGHYWKCGHHVWKHLLNVLGFLSLGHLVDTIAQVVPLNFYLTPEPAKEEHTRNCSNKEDGLKKGFVLSFLYF